jgi:hypothetical protein
MTKRPGNPYQEIREDTVAWKRSLDGKQAAVLRSVRPVCKDREIPPSSLRREQVVSQSVLHKLHFVKPGRPREMTHTTGAGLLSDAAVRGELSEPTVEEIARRRLADTCPYAFCFSQVTFDYAEGVLTLSGRLPTFYLKQMLQTFLHGLAKVEQIDNRVDVVSSTGLSSVRDK